MKGRTLKAIFVSLGMGMLLLAASAIYAEPNPDQAKPDAAKAIEAKAVEAKAVEAKAEECKAYEKEKGDFAKELGLTPEQQELLKKHREETKEAKKQLYQEMKANKTALHDELKKPAPDKAAIQSVVAGMKELEGKQIDSRVESFLKMKEILTPEQFAKMMEMGEKRHHEKGFGRKGWKKGTEKGKEEGPEKEF